MADNRCRLTQKIFLSDPIYRVLGRAPGTSHLQETDWDGAASICHWASTKTQLTIKNKFQSQGQLHNQSKPSLFAQVIAISSIADADIVRLFARFLDRTQQKYPRFMRKKRLLTKAGQIREVMRTSQIRYKDTNFYDLREFPPEIAQFEMTAKELRALIEVSTGQRQLRVLAALLKSDTFKKVGDRTIAPVLGQALRLFATEGLLELVPDVLKIGGEAIPREDLVFAASTRDEIRPLVNRVSIADRCKLWFESNRENLKVAAASGLALAYLAFCLAITISAGRRADTSPDFFEPYQ